VTPGTLTRCQRADIPLGQAAAPGHSPLLHNTACKRGSMAAHTGVRGRSSCPCNRESRDSRNPEIPKRRVSHDSRATGRGPIAWLHTARRSGPCTSCGAACSRHMLPMSSGPASSRPAADQRLLSMVVSPAAGWLVARFSASVPIVMIGGVTPRGHRAHRDGGTSLEFGLSSGNVSAADGFNWLHPGHDRGCTTGS